jgi:transmembrane sensor
MNQQIYTEASEWLVEFRTEQPGYDARKRFERWLSRSPEHVRAYLELTSMWETVAARPRSGPDEIDALIQRARQRAADNVVRMSPPRAAKYLPRTTSRRAALLAVASVLLVVGASAYYYMRSDVYTTGMGEQRSVLLSDGSTIDLNARSEVRVRLDAHERHLDLLSGQALFHVAKDKARPFIVAADGMLIRAVGTQFDINERKRELIVTVVEGTVAVSRPLTPVAPNKVESGAPTNDATADSSEKILLDAGQRLTLLAALSGPGAGTDQPTPVPRTVDIATATAWTQRRLVFDSTPLEDVIAEFNRNSQRILVIKGRGLEDFHVSGAFSSTDVQPFLRFLRAQNGVDVIEETDRIIITHR